MTSDPRFVKTRTVSHAKRLAILVGLVAIGIRFIALNQPFDDRWSWRQSDVAAIARNFWSGGFQFAKPQIDWAGDQPGYVGTEFPILPFTAALAYQVLGLHEWIGRLQSILFFAISLPFFYLLVRKPFGPVAAVWALIFYSFAPVMMMASRCFMPDVPSLSLGMVALYFFEKWTVERDQRAFWLSAMAMSFALLIKLPTAVMAVPMAVFVLRRSGWRAIREPQLYGWAAIALLPCLAWYWHAHRISETFYPYHFFGGGGVRIMPIGWYAKIAFKLSTSTLTPVLATAGLLGWWMTRRNKDASPFLSWFMGMAVFVVLVGWGNRHEWYQLPFVPIAAAFGGAACARIMSVPRPARVLIVSGVIASFGWLSTVYTHHLFESSAAPLRDVGLELKAMTTRDALVVAADDGDPTAFYYAERKGWHFPERRGLFYGNPADDEQLIADLDDLRQRGATHVVFYVGTMWWLDYYERFAEHLRHHATLMKSMKTFQIYKLNLAP